MSKAISSRNFSDEEIISKIYFVRGVKIMLDKDLAEMYEVPTSRLNEAVRRNTSRFPEDFMFQLTSEEYEHLRSQIAILKSGILKELIVREAKPRNPIGFRIPSKNK